MAGTVAAPRGVARLCALTRVLLREAGVRDFFVALGWTLRAGFFLAAFRRALVATLRRAFLGTFRLAFPAVRCFAVERPFFLVAVACFFRATLARRAPEVGFRRGLEVFFRFFAAADDAFFVFLATLAVLHVRSAEPPERVIPSRALRERVTVIRALSSVNEPNARRHGLTGSGMSGCAPQQRRLQPLDTPPTVSAG